MFRRCLRAEALMTLQALAPALNFSGDQSWQRPLDTFLETDIPFIVQERAE
jgi:hypothetical protein